MLNKTFSFHSESIYGILGSLKVGTSNFSLLIFIFCIFLCKDEVIMHVDEAFLLFPNFRTPLFCTPIFFLSLKSCNSFSFVTDFCRWCFWKTIFSSAALPLISLNISSFFEALNLGSSTPRLGNKLMLHWPTVYTFTVCILDICQNAFYDLPYRRLSSTLNIQSVAFLRLFLTFLGEYVCSGRIFRFCKLLQRAFFINLSSFSVLNRLFYETPPFLKGLYSVEGKKNSRKKWNLYWNKNLIFPNSWTNSIKIFIQSKILSSKNTYYINSRNA